MCVLDNVYQVMPDLTSEEYEELKSDILRRGVMVPVEFDEQGNVLDGHHRLRACSELGITDYPKVIRAGMTEEEKRTHARKLNMARRHLNREQKQSLIREQLKETPEKSDRQMASELSVSPTTVGTVRHQMEEAGQLSKLDSSIGADGKERPRQVERKPNQTAIHSEPEIKRPVSVFNPTKREERALNNPKVIERMAQNNTGVLNAENQVHREEKAERKMYIPESEFPSDSFRLFAGDIRDGASDIADSSVDFIITDPPYPREYLPLYGNLRDVACRVLKPGGSLIVMCGQSYLPDVIGTLSDSETLS